MFREHFLRRFLASLVIVTLGSLMFRSVLAAGPAPYRSEATGAGPAIHRSGATGAEFPDTAGTDYETAFAYLREKGIVSGYADGFARPGYPLNRVEALKVILEARGEYDARIAKFQKKMPPIPLFADIDQKQWYGPYIETAFEQGIITGYPDGTFRPGQLLRVEEAVAMLMRTFDEQGAGNKAELSTFIENQANQWYTPAINAAVNRNLVMHKGKLKLGGVISRGQFLDMVYRLHSITAGKKVAFDGAEPTEQQRIAVPVQRGLTYGGGTGVQTTSGVAGPGSSSSITPSVLPQNVTVGSRIHHPHASEKYFAISMPSLGIEDLTITHPQDAASKESVLGILAMGVGHLFSYPGGGGKIMIYGHSSGYPWDVSEFTKAFRRINELAVGDKVYVTYAGNLYIYEVTHEQTILASSADDAFKDDSSGEELILFTCWPPDSISQRYLVHAVPIETVALR